MQEIIVTIASPVILSWPSARRSGSIPTTEVKDFVSAPKIKKRYILQR